MYLALLCLCVLFICLAFMCLSLLCPLGVLGSGESGTNIGGFGIDFPGAMSFLPNILPSDVLLQVCSTQFAHSPLPNSAHLDAASLHTRQKFISLSNLNTHRSPIAWLCALDGSQLTDSVDRCLSAALLSLGYLDLYIWRT